MYKVLFQNMAGERRKIAIASTEEMCYRAINEFLEEKNYHSYYTRVIELCDGSKKIDVGSWSEFFFIVPDKSLDNPKVFEG